MYKYMRKAPNLRGKGGENSDVPLTLSPTFFLETVFQLRPEQTGRLCVAAAAAGLMRSVLPPSSCTSYLGRV